MNSQINYWNRISNALTHYFNNNNRKPGTIIMSLKDWSSLRNEISEYSSLPYFFIDNVRIEWSNHVIDDNTLLLD